MKKYLFKLTIFLLAVLVIIAPGLTYAADGPESFVVGLSNPGQPATLNIDSPFLQITVEAEKRDDMLFEITSREDDRSVNRGRISHPAPHVDINVDFRDRQRRDTSGMTRIDSNPGFVVEELNNIVSFESESNRWGYHVLVKVPVNTSLRLESVNSGALTVSGANGTHELSNANGSVYATNMSGSVVAETTNGEIVVTMLKVAEDTPMAFSTANGSVDVTFPASYHADATIDPGRGATYTDFEFEVDNAPRVETREGERGKRIEVKREVRAKINGGGPTLRMETFNGNIYIRKGG